MTESLSIPSQIGSGHDGVRTADLEGRLIIVKPEPEEKEIMTADFGPATVRPAKVLVLDGPDASNEWREWLIFGAALKAKAGPAARAGTPFAAVLSKGEAEKGKNAPWIFLDPTDAQLKLARKAYLDTATPF